MAVRHSPLRQRKITAPLLLALCTRRLLGEIGGALAALDGSRAQPADTMVLVACLPAMEQLCTLAHIMQLSPEEVAAFARYGALIVSDGSYHGLVMWLKAVAKASRSTGTLVPSAELFFLSAVPQQLSSADQLLQLLISRGGEGGLAAFAADVWPPQRVTRWLATVLVAMDAAKGAGVPPLLAVQKAVAFNMGCSALQRVHLAMDLGALLESCACQLFSHAGTWLHDAALPECNAHGSLPY